MRTASGGRDLARSTTPTATAATAIATSAIDECTGEGSTRRTATVRMICTAWPADRSHATARTPRLTSRTSRPWLIPRWTSPTTPPGSVTLRNTDR